jgi:CRISPR-associated protein Csx10
VTGLPAAFTVRVRMLSDWIVGTGEGRVGDVDATVRRDSDGLPFVPAKTLTGIWRDACEQVADWLWPQAGPAGNPWQVWVDCIFGSQPDVGTDSARAAGRAPEPAALSLSPARLPLPVRAACRARPALRAAAVVMRPGVTIDDMTGVARDDMLRLEERARPGVLEANAVFTTADGDVPVAAELLLRAGAAAVDALGGKRNRGAGRCWLLLPGMTGADGPAPAPAEPRPADPRLAKLARDTALLGDPGRPPGHHRPAVRLTGPGAHPAGADADERDGAAPTAPRTVWRVTFEVVTPVVAQHRVLGNVVLSRGWVPGSLLLPEILARLDRSAGHQDLVVGDARPAVATGQATVPGLPAPMTWYRRKDRHRHDVVNAAIHRPPPAERRKPMREGHVAPAEAAGWALLEPEMSVSTHAVIDDDAGRPDQARGGVFTYLGLAPGTVLASDIVLPANAGLALSVGDRIRLGRSRKDDFGEVEVKDVRAVPASDAQALLAGAPVRVWCVSDVLLRDAWGAPDPSPKALAVELGRRLGVSVSMVRQAPGAPVVQATGTARRDSFHTRWGRLRPSLTGLAAGSVVTLTVGTAVPAAALTAVQRDGIGERTAEGFGQVRFDAPELSVGKLELDPVSGRLPPPEPVGGGELALVPDVLEQAAVSAAIAHRVALIVGEGADRVIPGASQVRSRAQWGSLREQLPRLRSPGGRERVARWLDQTGQVRQRRDAWGKALPALRRLLTDETAVWADLRLGGAGLDELVLAPDRAGAVRASLWAHAVIVLITEIARDATSRLQSLTGEQDQG